MTNLKMLKNLCTANGISGDEKKIRDIILSEISDFVDEYKVDNLGNIIAFKKGKNRAKSKLLISAHMDEVGFIVTYITNEGLLKFTNVGGIENKILCAKGVSIGKNHIEGVIGIKPIHLTNSDERKKTIPISSMYIDIGAKSKDDALKYVKPGDNIYFDSIFEESENSIKSKALDDRAGCFLLIDLIKTDISYDMYFSFVVQEEIGLRGATTAAYSVDPDFAIVVEATTACDIPGVEESKTVCKLGSGAVIPFMDRSTIYDKELYNLANDIALKSNIKVQAKQAVAGGNDAGAIHISRDGVRTICISVPCRYLHSAVSLIQKDDLKNSKDILYKLSSKIAGELD